ncbi:MAG TPA: DUF4188 domain-containing protein [Frankiaceae bacterium]|nr:DUF4188 domain-containing protein [Frankiaceae bacterium]
MGAVRKGRFAAEIEGDFVVLVIGMRFNKPWAVHRWAPIAKAFTAMVKHLGTHPELGCLGVEQAFGRTTISVQYWRDFESLRRFARDPGLPHAEPWRRFNRLVADSGDVGVYHETYLVKDGAYEAIYTNLPPFGLAAASSLVPVARRGESASARLGLPD